MFESRSFRYASRDYSVLSTSFNVWSSGVGAPAYISERKKKWMWNKSFLECYVYCILERWDPVPESSVEPDPYSTRHPRLLSESFINVN